MRPFLYAKAEDRSAAVRAAAVQAEGLVNAPFQFLGGGTTLLDLMKLDVMRPEGLIDITTITEPDMRGIDLTADGLRIGSLVTMADAASHPGVARDYPVIAESLALAASAQLRNMARLGGNLLQRTRCSYFRDVSWPCNKREPGSGCSAMGGVNRLHAVLGASEVCIASYPGDLAQALIALDATIETVGPPGRRAFAVADLHRPPGDTPHIETNLMAGELIVAIRVPAGPWTRRSTYLKIRDRESYAFALASAAVALDLDDRKRVIEARIGLGGIAAVPWRARDAEAALRGRSLDDTSMNDAADAALAGATPHEHNAFKIPLGKQTIVRALTKARDMEI